MVKTIVITGANSGFGFGMTKHLVKEGHTVIMACRNRERGKAAKEKILAQLPDAKVHLMYVDVSDMTSVVLFSTALKNRFGTIDVLVNNAGIYVDQKKFTKDGFDLTYATNYLGCVLLSHLCLPLLTKGEGKIINVSSTAAFYMPFKMKKDLWLKPRKGFKIYSNSKLAQLMFTVDFAFYAKKHGVSVIAVHPGLVATNIYKGEKWVMGPVNKYTKKFKSADEASLIGVEVVLDSKDKFKSGHFYRTEGEVPYIKAVHNLKLRRVLHKMTVNSLQQYFK